jgi:hypothetical protein
VVVVAVDAFSGGSSEVVSSHPLRIVLLINRLRLVNFSTTTVLLVYLTEFGISPPPDALATEFGSQK